MTLGGEGGSNPGNATGWGGSGGGGSALCATGCLVNEAGVRSGSGRVEITYTTSSSSGGSGDSGSSGGNGSSGVPAAPNFTG